MKFKEKKRKVIFVEPATVERVEALRWKLQTSLNNVYDRAIEIGLTSIEENLEKNPKP